MKCLDEGAWTAECRASVPRQLLGLLTRLSSRAQPIRCGRLWS